MRRLMLFVLAVGSIAPAALGATVPQVYWSEAGGVVRASLDGSGVTSAAPGFEINGLSLDRARDGMFFTDIPPRVPAGLTGLIQHARLDGGGPAAILDSLPAPAALALDRVGGHVIWSDAELHSISIADYQGRDAKTILEPESSIAQIAGLAFDPWKQKIYYSYINPLIDSLRPGGIARMNLDGSERETVVSGLVAPQGVAYDHIRDLIYWADLEFGQGLIGRAHGDGRDPITLADGLAAPAGVAIDPYSNQYYWADHGTGKIQSGNTFIPQFDLISGRDQPTAIALLVMSGLAGDTNDDGAVDLFDLNDVRNYFGRDDGPGPGDADLDGDVDIDDLNAVRNHYGERFIPPAEARGVPEPSAALLAVAGGLALAAFAARQRTSPTAVRR